MAKILQSTVISNTYLLTVSIAFIIVTVHEKTMHDNALDHQYEIQAKIVIYGDIYQFSLFCID